MIGLTKLFLFALIDALKSESNNSDVFQFIFTPVSFTDIIVVLISLVALFISIKSYLRIIRIEMPSIETDSIDGNVYIIVLNDFSIDKNLNVRKIKIKFGKMFFYKKINFNYRYLNSNKPQQLEIRIMDILTLKPYRFNIYTNYGKLFLEKGGLKKSNFLLRTIKSLFK